MATECLALAEELLNVVTPEPFTKVLCLLHDSRATSIGNFKEQHKTLMKQHWLDSSALLSADKQCPTATGIFDVFGKRCGINATQITRSTATLIDNIFISHLWLGNYNSGVLIDDISDHLPSIVSLKDLTVSKKEPVKFTTTDT